ncbi:MAG: class I SAM-dependent methyltransferase [Verrucomicrobiota bacterium]
MKLETVTCNLCGSGESDLVFAVPSMRLREQGLRFDLRRCRACGLVRLSPRPESQAMATLYQPQHYTAPRHGLVRHLEGMILRERVSFVGSHARGKRVLDIGCGSGTFLQEMAEGGYEVNGLDPYQTDTAAIPEPLRDRIRNEPFESACYPAENFDIITLWHVLEHLAQPVEILQRIWRFLAPTGVLILEVPNFASREARWLGPHWYNLDVPYHFWHFTPEAVQAIASKAGFHITACVTSAVTRPVWLLNYLLLGSEAAANRWRSHHPSWSSWRQASLALGSAQCLATRLLFAGSCPMLRLVCSKHPQAP